MTEIESWKIWVLLGGIPSITTAVLGSLWYLFSKKIILKWTSVENEKLEEFRAKLNQNSGLLIEILKNQSNTYLLAQEKRLEAVESIWESTLKIKNEFPPAINVMYNLLTEKELKEILNDYNPDHTLPPMIRNFNAESYTSKMVTDSLHLDKHRIYIDTRIWTCFYVYRAFCGRIAYWVDKGMKEGQIKPWQQDAGIKFTLELLFKNDEVAKFLEPNSSFQFCVDSIEFKLFNEISELTTGKKYSDLYLTEFVKWHDQMNKLTDKNRLKK